MNTSGIAKQIHSDTQQETKKYQAILIPIDWKKNDKQNVGKRIDKAK